MNRADRYAGILWGTAVGDAIGLPAEGLLRRQIERLGWCDDWPTLVAELKAAVEKRLSMLDYTGVLGVEAGVSGYMYHTVPVVLFAWFRWHGEDDGFKHAMTEVLNCGGDVDTTGAIFGALAGARWGVDRIPRQWISGINDWPRSSKYIDRGISALLGQERPPFVWWPCALLRNLLFLGVVLSHGLLRLLPCRLRRKLF